MKLITLFLFVVLISATGCTTTPTQLERNPQTAQTCGQSVKVAIEGNTSVKNTDKECAEMKTTAREKSGESDMLLNIVAYIAGYLLASAFL